MAKIADELRKLDELYALTGRDWVLEISHILTEPVCPTIIIRPENLQISRYRVDADSIESGIAQAVDMVVSEVIRGEAIKPVAPFTNPDDRTWQDELRKIGRDRDA